MLIKLHKSHMFKIDTAKRFARQYGVQPKVWNEVWKRANLGYDYECLAGYVLYKTGIRLSTRTLSRWLALTEIYCRANHVMRMGVRVVQSEYFGAYEDLVLKEVLANMRFNGIHSSRILV